MTLTAWVALIDAETVTGSVDDVISPPGEMAAAVACAMICAAAASVALAEAICWLARGFRYAQQRVSAHNLQAAQALALVAHTPLEKARTPSEQEVLSWTSSIQKAPS